MKKRSSKAPRAKKAAHPAPRARSGALTIPSGNIKLQNVLVPIDFSRTSLKALRYAISFAREFSARISVLHIIEPVAAPDFAYHPLMMDPQHAIEAAKKRLQKLAENKQLSGGLLGKTLVRTGVPYAEIAEAARALKADLIILTTHGYTGLKHVFLGSTAERVVRHAPCPVLTVREKEHEFVR